MVHNRHGQERREDEVPIELPSTPTNYETAIKSSAVAPADNGGDRTKDHIYTGGRVKSGHLLYNLVTYTPQEKTKHTTLATAAVNEVVHRIRNQHASRRALGENCPSPKLRERVERGTAGERRRELENKVPCRPHSDLLPGIDFSLDASGWQCFKRRRDDEVCGPPYTSGSCKTDH